MKRDEILIILGTKIRAERVKRGYSQSEFANMIGKDQPSLARIETGRVNPGYLILKEIADGLEIDISELLSVK